MVHSVGQRMVGGLLCILTRQIVTTTLFVDCYGGNREEEDKGTGGQGRREKDDYKSITHGSGNRNDRPLE